MPENSLFEPPNFLIRWAVGVKLEFFGSKCFTANFFGPKSFTQVLSAQYPLSYPCDRQGYCNRVLDVSPVYNFVLMTPWYLGP